MFFVVCSPKDQFKELGYFLVSCKTFTLFEFPLSVIFSKTLFSLYLLSLSLFSYLSLFFLFLSFLTSLSLLSLSLFSYLSLSPPLSLFLSLSLFIKRKGKRKKNSLAPNFALLKTFIWFNVYCSTSDTFLVGGCESRGSRNFWHYNHRMLIDPPFALCCFRWEREREREREREAEFIWGDCWL